MMLLRTLALSLRALFAYRMRSALAAAGVAIGIAAVFLTSAIGQGAQQEILKNIGVMGTRLLVVRPAQVVRTSARKELRGFVSSLKLEDAQSIAALPEVEDVAPSVEGPFKVKTSRDIVATQVLGTTPGFFRARSFELEHGRLFDDGENDELARFAVLGGRARQNLFPGEDAVGQEVRIGGVAFEVVGTLRAKGVSGDGADADNQVFIPVRTALQRVFNSHSLTRIFVCVRAPGDRDRVEQAIRTVLRERHGLTLRGRADDFAVQNQLRLLSAQQKTARALRWFTSGLAALSLLIGGTGILALMLLSVRERTPEIGLRMAVGARRRDILLQFLAEATALSLLGGAGGTLIGFAGTYVVASITSWPVRPSFSTALVSLGASVTTGLLFGVLPARKASFLTPIRAFGLE